MSTKISHRTLAGRAVVILAIMFSCLSVPNCIAFAQQPERRSFEVDTVKSGDPIDPHWGVGFGSNGRFRANNASLQMLLVFAYKLQTQQISGGPKWVNSEKFSIEAEASSATPSGPVDIGQIRLMLQALLADRFKLVVHRSTIESKIYELLVRSGGSKLKEAGANDGRVGLRIEPGGAIVGAASPISPLVDYLSEKLQRSVIDKTGLSGKYDFTLKRWTSSLGPLDAPQDEGEAPRTSDSSPSRSLFAALQEDLGLKLQPGKGPIEMLIIDQVQKPDPN
jgi:uncharacterized protein (TIGR03435 family)